ncbi:MAG: undecaprenyl-diphosphate phosphatase [Candidatus Nanohalobium sp.]
MELITAVIIGIIQGVAEWLPISSEAVISLIMQNFMGRAPLESVNASVWLHTGTMIAALLYFRADFVRLTKEFFQELPNMPETYEEKLRMNTDSDDWKMILFVAVVTAITAAIGGTIYVLGLKTVANYPKLFTALTGVALFVTGLTRLYEKAEDREISDLNYGDTVLTGLLQSFSILPGISRSGITSFALLYRDYKAEDAFKLSFIISVPAVAAANVGLQIFSGFTVSTGLVIASAVSMVVGYAMIEAVLRVAHRAEVAYICFALGLLSFVPLFL